MLIVNNGSEKQQKYKVTSANWFSLRENCDGQFRINKTPIYQTWLEETDPAFPAFCPLKGKFRFSEEGLYAVFIHSQRTTYSRQPFPLALHFLPLQKNPELFL